MNSRERDLSLHRPTARRPAPCPIRSSGRSPVGPPESLVQQRAGWAHWGRPSLHYKHRVTLKLAPRPGPRQIPQSLGWLPGRPEPSRNRCTLSQRRGRVPVSGCGLAGSPQAVQHPFLRPEREREREGERERERERESERASERARERERERERNEEVETRQRQNKLSTPSCSPGPPPPSFIFFLSFPSICHQYFLSHPCAPTPPLHISPKRDSSRCATFPHSYREEGKQGGSERARNEAQGAKGSCFHPPSVPSLLSLSLSQSVSQSRLRKETRQTGDGTDKAERLSLSLPVVVPLSLCLSLANRTERLFLSLSVSVGDRTERSLSLSLSVIHLSPSLPLMITINGLVNPNGEAWRNDYYPASFLSPSLSVDQPVCLSVCLSVSQSASLPPSRSASRFASIMHPLPREGGGEA